MILDDNGGHGLAAADLRTTLDDLFRRAAVRHPNAVALVDPPNRESFTDGVPCRLTYVEADRAISSIARRLRALGLKTDAVVAIHLPNTVESILTLLGVMRAGMIVAPMPLLWRKADMAAALTAAGAKAIVTTTRVMGIAHAEIAMQTAAAVFSIRHIGAFGHQCPEGATSFDESPAAREDSAFIPEPRPGNAAAHVAAITWEVTAAGLVPVARSHAELVSAGLAMFLAANVADQSAVLSTIPVTSFAGFAVTLMPWLLARGALVLHQAFDQEIFSAQSKQHGDALAVLPGTLAERMRATTQFATQRAVLALWRAPERLSARARTAAAGLIDVAAFGEIGLAAARRSAGEDAAPLITRSPALEAARSDNGTLMLRGAMVPRAAFPPGAERGTSPHLAVAADGYVDTGFPCRLLPDGGTFIVSGPPAGIVGIGGYRFYRSVLEKHAGEIAADAVIAALPNALLGERLAGTAAASGLAKNNPELNPLIGGVFRIHHTPDAA